MSKLPSVSEVKEAIEHIKESTNLTEEQWSDVENLTAIAKAYAEGKLVEPMAMKDRRERMRELLKELAYEYHYLGQKLDTPIGFEKVDSTIYALEALMGEERVYTPCCTDTIGMPIHCNHKKPKPQAVSVEYCTCDSLLGHSAGTMPDGTDLILCNGCGKKMKVGGK